MEQDIAAEDGGWSEVGDAAIYVCGKAQQGRSHDAVLAG